MDSNVRLLPALIGAAAVLALLRLASMLLGESAAFSTVSVAAATEPTPAPPQSDAAAAPAPTLAAAAVQASAPSATPPAATQPQSKGEADVLRGLTDRRGELDARENELALREQLLAATQRQVDDKIGQLKALQGKLDEMLAQRDDAQKAQLTSLVKMYEAMKPTEAAKIFEQLDRRILADVAGGMKPAKVGPVLAAMQPEKAQALTALLATRLVLPEPQQAAAAALPPPVPSEPMPAIEMPAPMLLPPAEPVATAPTPTAPSAPSG